MPSRLQPSSATTGFFQPSPTVPPQYSHPSTSTSAPSTSPADPCLPHILTLYLPSPTPPNITHSLSRFAARVLSPSLLALTASADTSPPTLHSVDSFGRPNRAEGVLKTSAAWQSLVRVGVEEGIVGLGFADQDHDDGNGGTGRQGTGGGGGGGGAGPGGGEGAGPSGNRRIHQFVKYHLWTGSAALVTCPAAMTDGAAVLLGRHLATGTAPLTAPSTTATATTTPASPDTAEQYPPSESHARRDSVFREARRRLISRDPAQAWSSGQWMTERQGGSDVSGTETVARRLPPEEVVGEDAVGMPLGDWVVDGFKWFSSATDADCAVLLARTEGGGGQRGLSAFFAPMKRRIRNGGGPSVDGVGGEGNGEVGVEFNGVRIQRLKNKMGTRALPTAELELRGMRAWLVGKEGEGVKEISAILNITRLHTAVSQVGYWGRGLAVSRAYAKVRRVAGGTLLQDVKQHVAWMADETVRYHAAMHLTYFAVALLGVGEQGLGVVQDTRARGLVPESAEEVGLLLRVLTPLMKAQTALASIQGLRACMESLGGLGYLENNEDPLLNIARLYRDANVGAIWEGTTSVMADDVIRVLKGKLADLAIQGLENWITRSLAATASVELQPESETVTKAWLAFKQKVQDTEAERLQWRGREVLNELELIVCGCILIFNARLSTSTDGQDKDEIQVELARRWVSNGKGKAKGRPDESSSSDDWRKDAAMDREIFLGEVSHIPVAAKL